MKKSTAKKFWMMAAVAMGFVPSVALAAPDALTAINNLKNLMLDLLTAIGIILVIWGIVQVAIGFKSQDGTQKVHGLLFLGGGLMIASIGSILTVLGF